MSRVVIWATVALVVFGVLVPAQGLYFAFFKVSHPLFYWDCLALVLIAAWGAFGSQTLLVRFSGSLALASLLVANIAFSAATFRALSISDGLAILGAFWLLPWLLLWGLRSIPRVGLLLGKQHDGEVRLVQRPWNTRDLLATVCFAAVILYVFVEAFPTAVAADESWLEASHQSWGEGISTGLLLTSVVALALWSGLNQRKWLFAIVFGALSLIALNSFVRTLAGNPWNVELLPFLFAIAVVIYLPVCLRLAGYRVVRRRQAVVVRTDQPEPLTADSRPQLWAFHWPVLGIAVAWMLTASLSGAVARHAFHCTGEFFYGSLDSKTSWGNLQGAQVPLDQAERLLRSPLFRTLPELTVAGVGEVDGGLVEASLLHDQLRDLDLSRTSLSESQFLRLARGKDWEGLSVRYPPRLVPLIETSRSAARASSIKYLRLWATNTEQRDALTVAAVEQVLESLRIDSIWIKMDHSLQQPANYDLLQLAELSGNHPGLRIFADLGSQQGSLRIEDDLLHLEAVNLLDQTAIEAISILKPRTFVAQYCDTEFADVSADRRELLKQLSLATRGFQSVRLASSPLDRIFLEHFATADGLELVLMFAGPLEPEDAREIAARANVETLSLSCAGIQAEAVAALRDAENLKTVYYRDDWNPHTLALLRRELAGVEILPLSTRKSSP